MPHNKSALFNLLFKEKNRPVNAMQALFVSPFSGNILPK